MKLPRSAPSHRRTESQPVLPETELLLDEREKSPVTRQSPPSSPVLERAGSLYSETFGQGAQSVQSDRPPPYEGRPEPPSRKPTLPAQPAFLTASLDTQEELAEQLAQMGRQLKLNALHLANSISKEKNVLEDAGEKLERNLDTMTKERVRLRDHRGKSGVFFDALFTIVKPRRPIASQYTQVINSHVTKPVPESAVAAAFPEALKEVQVLKPAYEGGKDTWWAEVIRRTALKAGADGNDVNAHIPQMTEQLLNVFRSKEGYALYPDVIETFEALKEAGVRIGLVSNTDGRMRDALADLGVLPYLDASVALSEEEKVEKPSPVLWEVACHRAGIERPASAGLDRTAGKATPILHVGDELDADYLGALGAGLDAILLRRPGDKVVGRQATELEATTVRVAESLAEVVAYVLGSHK
ncbi:hypothetical protein FRB90_006036 [Tulasnella sp. 427]|nr:hypothetical protein FRB90_006036 [Tulasnella sp. 427]